MEIESEGVERGVNRGPESRAGCRAGRGNRAERYMGNRARVAARLCGLEVGRA